MIGTVSMDDACAVMLAKSGIIPALIELLNGNMHTSGFPKNVLHITFLYPWSITCLSCVSFV